MPKTSPRLTETERAERRARDRDRLQHATEALLSGDGWQRWVRWVTARATFHAYSLVILSPCVCGERAPWFAVDDMSSESFRPMDARGSVAAAVEETDLSDGDRRPDLSGADVRGFTERGGRRVGNTRSQGHRET